MPDPDPPAGATMTAVAAGTSFSLALDSDSILWAWGNNGSGQLGDGTREDSSAPIDTLTNARQISAGARHALALAADGTVWAWGHNNRGQIGVGWPSAVDVDVETWVLGNGGWHFGLPTADARPTPYRVPEFTALEILELVELSASANHVLGLDADGNLYGWDENRYGQLAQNPATLVVEQPEQIVISGVGSLLTAEAGGGVSIGVAANGDVYNWGRNAFCELGDGSATGVIRADPRRLDSLSDVISVSAAPHRSDSFGAHVLALTDDGDVYAWGYNRDGQVGNGATADRLTPVRLVFDSPAD